MTEDQRIYRRWARDAATQTKHRILESEKFMSFGMVNRARFYAIAASHHARRAARFAFMAHPELRVAAPNTTAAPKEGE